MIHRKSIYTTTRYRNIMLYLIITIVCIIFATMIAFAFLDVCINYSFKEAIKAKGAIPLLITGIAFIVLSFVFFPKYKAKIQSDAIDHYVMGDVELHEKVVDGEVVDWQYIVTPSDYE